MPIAAHTDPELVHASLSGNRDAFGHIVARYQSLICSLAYSATGSLTTSEDLAQETFVTAWKQLAGLREPEKLRAWLCGIVRHLILNALRREGREPSHQAESLDEISASPAPGLLPTEQTISNEELAILWRALEAIPESYREPLVLFYREHQSIEAVAQNLELSKDAVKQRLARGRKLLHEQVLAFVEGALERTIPGKVFTASVLAALPITLTTSAKAATLGAAAAKGSVAAKAAVSAGMFGMLLTPLLTLVGSWFQYRMWLKSAPSESERVAVKRYVQRIGLTSLLFVIGFLTIFFGGFRFLHTHPVWYASALIALVATFTLSIGFFGYGLRRGRPGHWREYRSRIEWCGLPLVHIRASNGLRSPVVAWIAGGDYAIGLIAAFGGVAVAPLSMGGVAIGLISLGGMALGVVPFGGFAFGGWAVGGLALGWQSFGGYAMALNAAEGGVAIARDFAHGGAAQAAESNPEIAAQFFRESLFFRSAEILARHALWLNLLWLLPFSPWRTLAKRSKGQPTSAA